MFDDIPISTIELPEGRLQTFPETFPAREAYIKVAPLSE